MELDEALLPLDSSNRDFQKGKVGYRADLRTLKKHEQFLTLKRDLAIVSLFTC